MKRADGNWEQNYPQNNFKLLKKKKKNCNQAHIFTINTTKNKTGFAMSSFGQIFPITSK